MARLSTLLQRLRAFLGADRLEDGLDDEMRLHMDLLRDRLQTAGVSPDEARAAARRRFGNPLLVREQSVDMWGWRWLEQLAQDVRFALRTLHRSPGFTVTVVDHRAQTGVGRVL